LHSSTFVLIENLSERDIKCCGPQLVIIDLK